MLILNQQPPNFMPINTLSIAPREYDRFYPRYCQAKHSYEITKQIMLAMTNAINGFATGLETSITAWSKSVGHWGVDFAKLDEQAYWGESWDGKKYGS